MKSDGITLHFFFRILTSRKEPQYPFKAEEILHRKQMQVTLIRQNTIDRLFGWWYAISAPPPVPEDAPLHEREFMRKAKFTSIVLLIEIIESFTVFVLPDGPSLLIPLSISVTMLIVGVFLNRSGKVRLAGTLIWLTINLGMYSDFISLGLHGGLSSISIQNFFSLIHPDLIAISLLPAPAALAVGIANCLFTILALTFLPKTPELLHQFSTPAVVAIYYLVLYAQTVVVSINLLWVSSNFQQTKRADQAEELNKLIQALSTQQQDELQRKQQLEQDIQRIVAVHTQVANGNYNARVPLDQIGHNNVLWSIAGSLNTLLARLQRWNQEAQQLRRTEQAILQTLQHIQLTKKQGIPLHLQRSGTSLDALLTEIIGDMPRTEQAIQQTLQHIQLAKKQGMPLHLQRTGTSLDALLAEIIGDMPYIK